MLTTFIISTVVLQGVIALFVYFKQRSSSTNILFALLSVSLIGWATANFFATSVTQDESAITWIRLVIFFVVLQNYFFYLFTKVFPENRSRLRGSKVMVYSLFSLVVAADALSPFLFTGVTINAGQASPVPGPGIVLFVIHAAFSVFGGFMALIRKYRRSKGISRAQLKYILLGSTVLWLIVPVTNFVVTLTQKTNLFPKLSSVYTLIFSSVMAYVIVRHRFLDIRAVVARSVAYALLLGTLGLFYGLTFFGVTALLFPAQASSIPQQLLYAFLAVAIAFTFQPLKGFFELLTDRIFFRDHYDSQELLNELGKILVSEIQLDPMLQKTLVAICEELKVVSGQFYVFNHDRIYKVKHHGPLPSKIITANHLQLFRHNLLIADEIEAGHNKSTMEEFGFRVIMRLRTKEEFVGYLLLGDKQSGDIYSPQDIKTLQILAQELAVAISNAKAYEEIAAFNLTLQDKINIATKNLREANQRLKELDEAKDEFISMASHQLRTPLTSIKGYLSMLLEGDAGKVSGQQKEFMESAYRGSQRMVNLISDLLNVSRMSAGRFVLEKKPTDVEAMVKEEIAQLQAHAKDKQLILKLIPPRQRLPIMNIDEGKTRQVVMNFIDNAIFYTKHGSVTVFLDVIDGQLELRVADTGIGVPRAARSQLFGKFFRAANAQSLRPDGTGLGLFLAKRVVEDQGGKIIFESEEGRGSTFGFRMPIVATKPPVKIHATHH